MDESLVLSGEFKIKLQQHQLDFDSITDKGKQILTRGHVDRMNTRVTLHIMGSTAYELDLDQQQREHLLKLYRQKTDQDAELDARSSGSE